MRVDSEGALCNSEEFLAFCSGLSIRVEPIAGEAPWQLGRHSRHLGVLLQSVNDILTEFPDMSLAEAVVRATMAKNERAMIQGFTPVQRLLGRQDSVLGSVIQGDLGEISHVLDG